MKNFVTLFAGLLLLGACLNKTDKNSGQGNASVNNLAQPAPLLPGQPEDSSNYTDIQWIDSVKTMGKINEGQKLEVGFRFKNTGNKPLVIRSVRASCGCTTPDPPTKSFAPGETGEIKATFDSKGRSGFNKKEIYVGANTHKMQTHILTFDVEVIKSSQ